MLTRKRACVGIAFIPSLRLCQLSAKRCLQRSKSRTNIRLKSRLSRRYYSLLNFFGEFPLADKHSLGGRFVGGFIQVHFSPALAYLDSDSLSHQVMGAAVMAIPAGALGNAFSEVVEKELAKEEDAVRPSLLNDLFNCLRLGRRNQAKPMAMPRVNVARLFPLLACSLSVDA